MIGENEAEFEFDVDGIDEVTFTIDDEGNDIVPSSETETKVDNNSSENNVPEVQTDEITFTVPEPGEVLEEGKEEAVHTEDKPSDNSVPSSPSFVADFASALAKDGIITGVDDEKLKEITDLSKLANAIKDTIKSNEFSDLDERAKSVLEAIRNGVAVETIEKLHNTEMQLEQFTEDRFIGSEEDDEAVLSEKENIRRSLIFNDLKVRGFSDDVAKRKTDASFNSGDDEEDAKLAIQNLKAKAQERKQMEFQAAAKEREKYEKQREELKQNVLKTEEILPGIKVSEDMRLQVSEMMTVATGRTPDGRLRTAVSDKRAENPDRFDTRLNYLIAMGMFDDKPDMSLFTNIKVSSAIQELEKNLDTTGLYDGGRGISLDSVAKAEKKALDLSLLDNMNF